MSGRVRTRKKPPAPAAIAWLRSVVDVALQRLPLEQRAAFRAFTLQGKLPRNRLRFAAMFADVVAQIAADAAVAQWRARAKRWHESGEWARVHTALAWLKGIGAA